MEGRGKQSRAPAAGLLFNSIAKLSKKYITVDLGVSAKLQDPNLVKAHGLPPHTHGHTQHPFSHSAAVATKRQSKEWRQQLITFYKNRWVCYQGASADGIAIKHVMASRKRDSPVTQAEGVGSGGRCSRNKVGGHKNKTASIMHQSGISIKINSLTTSHQFFIQRTSQQSTASYTSSKGTVYTCQLALPSAEMAANTDWGTASNCSSHISPNNM